MKESLITIVVPIYNVERYLRRCVDSLISQSYENLEILLINDGSPDHSLDICKEYQTKDARVRVISQENKGLAYTRNVGVSEAKGEYIMFVDSDDYIHKDMAKILMTNLQKSNADLSACGHLEVHENGYQNCLNKKHFLKTYTPEEALKVFMFTYEIDIINCNKLFSKKLFAGIEYPTGKLFEDHYTVYKLIARCSKVVFDSRPLYYYCKRGDSIGGSVFSNKNLQLLDAIHQEVEDILRIYPRIAKHLDLAEICWAIVVYDKMMLANSINKEFEKKLSNKILGQVRFIMLTSVIRISRKVQLLLFAFNKKMYKYVYIKFLEKYRGAEH